MEKKILDMFVYDGDFIYSSNEPYAPQWALDALADGRLFYEGPGDLYVAGEESLLVSVGDYIMLLENGEVVTNSKFVLLDNNGLSFIGG